MENFTIDSDQIYNYVQEQIENVCVSYNILSPYKFIPYYVKLLLLNPKWKIGDRSDIITERRHFEVFIKYCISQLSLAHNTTMETLKMQRYFSFGMENLYRQVQAKRETLKLSLERLEEEIVNVTATDEDTLRELYRKIVYYITLLNGLGDPTDVLVYKEAITALHSVFDKKDLLNFINETSFEKGCDLEELAGLVAGIRLFNRDCNRGGQGILDVNGLLSKVITILTEHFQKSLIRIMDNVNSITTAIDISFKIECDDSYCSLYCVVPAGIGYEEVEKIKDTLVAYRQYEIINRRFLAEIEQIYVDSKRLEGELLENFQKLHNLVNHHTAIPAVTVFPIFGKISEVWKSLQNHIVRLSKLQKLGENIREFEREIIVNRKTLRILLGNNETLTDAERLEKTTGEFVTDVQNPQVRVLYPNQMKDFDKLPLKYLGFCAWKFVKSNGGLFPGNPNLGVLEYKNNYYVFSSIAAAKAFSLNPERYINQALDVARNKPEVINLLQLYDEVYCKRDVEEVAEYTPRRNVIANAEVQTLLHPIESNIDKDYKWNVWDLRRQAITMANISTCKTHSTQTNKSSFKNDVRIQTYGRKEQTCQTKRDNYTNVPRLSNFIYGLRGRKDDKQFIIELTRPVNE